MTNVFFEYNPFNINSYITVDGIPVSETSGLYKYVKTPLQDWIKDFFFTLAEYCNDDEIKIIFKGLLYNFDDMKRALNTFIESNPSFEIILEYQECISLNQRIDIITHIVAEMQKYNFLEDNEILEIKKSLECKMSIYISGENFEDNQNLSHQLYKAAEMNNLNCICEFKQVNSFNQFVFHDKSIIIYNFNKDNQCNCEMLKRLVNDYKGKRKIEKCQYIFLSSSSRSLHNKLSTVYGLKNVIVLDRENILEIIKRIYDYHANIYMTSNLLNCVHLICNYLTKYEDQLIKNICNNINIDDLEVIEKEVFILINNIQMIMANPFEDKKLKNKLIRKFLIYIDNKFYLDVFEKKQSAVGNYTEKTHLFFESLPNLIEQGMLQLEKAMFINVKYKIDDNLFKMLSTLSCTESFNKLIERKEYISESNFLAVDYYLASIEEIKVIQETNYLKNDLGFFSGLLDLLLELENKSDFDDIDLKKYCRIFFNSHIEDIKPIIVSFYDDCLNLLMKKQKFIESDFNDILDNIIYETQLSIKKAYLNLQNEEQIYENRRIVNELKQQAETLIIL